VKRSGFASRFEPRPSRQWEGGEITPRAPALRIVDTSSRLVLPLPKENALQHLGYMSAVRLQPCCRCNWYRKRWMQFCHADEGKGTGIKTDCRLGWSGCGPHDDLPGCHWFVGSSGRMGKEGRREFETFAGAVTRAAVAKAGLWPARLPRWPG
jgi:hypothetical protein